MTQFEATPTEYKGIVYRSKSEAMFARYLEIYISWSSLLAGGFSYEPKEFNVDGWLPDFFIWEVHKEKNTVVPQTVFRLIEYKPSKPTRTYLNNFSRKALNTIHWANKEKGISISAFCYWGSIYNTERSVLGVRKDGTSKDLQDDWLYCIEDEIKSTRFDLENHG